MIKHEGVLSNTVPLEISDKPSTFQGTLEIKAAGLYEVVVYAYDPKTGNTGVDKTTFIVSQ